MAKEGDMSLFNDVLEPFRRVINTDPPKDKLSSASKLNFSDSNQSLKEGLSNLLSFGKRKSSMGMNDNCTPEKRLRTESGSTPASAPPSPWEAKRMKIDLIAAKAQITKLESRINHQHTIRKEMQILFDEEKNSLVEQHKRDERALSDMEARLELIRRREQEIKDEYNEAVKELKDSKANWDKEKSELLKQIADLRDKLLECNVSGKDQLSEMKKDMDELLQALEAAQSEAEMLRTEVTKQTSRAEQCTTLRNQLEKQSFELQTVTNKLKELEYERDSYKDWQQQAKTAQKRLTNMAELEKEVARLRAQERSLRDAACNKLLLEEQVHQLQSRVDALQPVQNELHEAKLNPLDAVCKNCLFLLQQSTQTSETTRKFGYRSICIPCGYSILRKRQTHSVPVSSTERNIILQRIPTHQVDRLEKVCILCWMKASYAVGKLRRQDDNRPELPVAPLEIADSINIMQPPPVPVPAEFTITRTVKLASLESSLEEWKNAARTHGVENARALSSALDSALNSQLSATAASSQAQSQLAQLTEEVATVKFERDTATSKLNELLIVRKNQESLIHRLQKRLLLVTRERDSYRQQLDCYEKELTVTLCGEAGAGGAALLSARVEQLEKALQGYRDLLATHDQTSHTKLVESLRAESSKWREEAETLRRDVAKLRAQRDALHTNLERIAAQSQTKVLHMTNNPAAEAQKQIQVDLEAAQEEIKRLKASLTEGGDSRACPEEMQQLRQQLESSRIKLKRLKEEFTSSAQEYRDVCYMLLGYKIDRTGHKNYRISNMYAESSEEYLTFTLDDDGIEMVHTDYSSTLGELVELHLHQHRSIPLFLSALTMELFTRTTMQQVE